MYHNKPKEKEGRGKEINNINLRDAAIEMMISIYLHSNINNENNNKCENKKIIVSHIGESNEYIQL